MLKINLSGVYKKGIEIENNNNNKIRVKKNLLSDIKLN
jgi:hypothetical protein